jgi:hypothetical protein
MKTSPFARRSLLSLALFAAVAARAWDAAGHSMINQLALAALPADFPAYVRTPEAAARIAFLANVPDRWRDVDPWLKNPGPSWTDHFMDVEQLGYAGLDAHTVSSFRFEFAIAFAKGRAEHADKFSPIDPTHNVDQTRQWPGFAPWAVAEWCQKMRSAFSYLKAYEEGGGTPEEIANSKQDVIYAMGVLGHYVGDSAQPLHSTVHHNGWVGANPNGYTTATTIHSWIDGGFIAKAGIKPDNLRPRVVTAEAVSFNARPDGRDPLFVAAMDFLLAQHELVEPLYKLEKDGLLGNGDKPITPEGRAFIEGQILKGSQMLASLWVTAWKSAPVDTYLRASLARRQTAATGASTHP